jgi:hypothetical protein
VFNGDSLTRICGELINAATARDAEQFRRMLSEVPDAARRAEPAQIVDGLIILAPLLAVIPLGIGADLAQLAGAMAGLADDPMIILPILVDRAASAMEQAARFAALHSAELDRPPDSGDPSLIEPTIARMTGAADRLNLGEPEIVELAAAWFTGSGWLQPVLYLAQRKDVRLAMPQRERLTAAVAARAEDIGNAQWLHGLLLVLDDEPLIALHRDTGRGFRLTISGVGDNSQLQTLLAAHLRGGRWRGKLPGRTPSAAVVAAATDGDPTPAEPIVGQFNLVDGYGKWIWTHGRPYDIPFFRGVRVVVLDPPPYARSWPEGRVYPLMTPTVTVAEPLPRAEAAQWLGLVAPPAAI